MPILFDEKKRQFHLKNDILSYVIQILPSKKLAHIYFGEALCQIGEGRDFLDTTIRSMAPLDKNDEEHLSLDVLPQEVSIYGRGDLRQTQLEFLFQDHSTVTDFKYHHHEIFAGKKKLTDLPSVNDENKGPGTSLWIYLKDDLHDLTLVLKYFLFDHEGMLLRSVEVINGEKEEVTITRGLSLNLDLPDGNYKQLKLTGAWARERQVEVDLLHRGVQQIYSLRGHSSHHYNPFIALLRPEATEQTGEVLGFSFVYSGNFLGQVEVDTYDYTRVMMGIHPEGFNWPLATSQHLELPEVALVYAKNGLNEMSQTYHRVFNKYLVKEAWQEKRRPILINSWEAVYFNFDATKLEGLIEKSQQAGMELFVLDDGWFGKRNDDTSSLGDWDVNLEKLPTGIEGISKKVKEAGMKFGLWFEPEMINEKSELFKKHPDWVLGDLSKPYSLGRHQLCLDLSKQEVVDYLFEKMVIIIKAGQLDYIKWDMNRTMSEVYSQKTDPKQQGTIYHRCVLEMYALHQRLLDTFPHLLIEGCASGGARFDAGMLYYVPQIWTSDNTDAFDRIKIQYGTSIVYPISSIGAHVSASPNHQTGRRMSLATRSHVAAFGTYGFELDLGKLSDAEQKEVAEELARQKQDALLIQQGTFYRLLSPFEGEFTAWMSVKKDQTEAIAMVFKQLGSANERFPRLKFAGLLPQVSYELKVKGKEFSRNYYGDELMKVGIPINHFVSEDQDYQSALIYLKKV